ncbi:hypothetical protein [Rhodococcus tukisamuensis]|uniref:Ig-like domain-containing protein n=1 Tax=Rhodococcus tukisamuensis TaxID=168276 RepID=A0A1G6W986_9NOCA|nr:hypothetical protein [Rhodococcus tukisamuensis]SDD62374.1 hypothetical protein SAMN05444580_105291 [Rhodococcus tukisamuensis]
MFKHVVAVAALAAGAALTLVPAASAASPDDPYGWNTYNDKTSAFVAPLDPGAFTDKADKAIVLSPFGTTRTIECKGDGHYVGVACRQSDPAGVQHDLVPVMKAPMRAVWVYNPFGAPSS